MTFDSRLLGGIEVMIAVAETGSFVRAGEALGLTASGVSRAIARLESRLGVRLFERNARATVLTDAGQRLHAEVAPLLAAITEAAGAAAGSGGRVRGRLRVNCDPWFASLMLAPRLRTFLDAHPDISLEFVVRDRLGDLVSDGFDAAIRFGEPEPSGLVTRKLLDTRILTCAAPSYLERYERPRHPRDLETGRHECLLFRDPATGRPFDWEFHRPRPSGNAGDPKNSGTQSPATEILNVKVRGRLMVSDVQTSLSACMAGLGIAQPMALGIDALLASGRLIELFPDWNGELFPLHVYYPSRHLMPAKVRVFVQFVLDAIGDGADRRAFCLI